MKLFLSFILIVSISLSRAQNLVPNPSFEEYDICPTDVGEFSSVSLWYNCNDNTPDYYNSCAAGTNVAVPCNLLGCQEPAMGNGYAGLYGFGTIDEYREIIGVQLTGVLAVGQTYYVSFLASPAYGIAGGNRVYIFSNKLGVKFSMTEYGASNTVPIDNFAHIFTNEIISDTSDWSVIQGSFIADASYSYLMLGNFFDNGHTDTITAGSHSTGAYYYIDDVCVSTNADDCLYSNNISLEMPTAFTPNGDSQNDIYFPVFFDNSILIHEFRIYNRWGQLIYNNPNSGWDGEYQGESQPSDVYSYYIYVDISDPDNPSKRISHRKQGSFTLLR